jgi:hypothetical protein
MALIIKNNWNNKIPSKITYPKFDNEILLETEEER